MDQADNERVGTTHWWSRGIVGESWTGALLTGLLLVVWYSTSLLYPVLNHGPNRIYLRTPLDDAIPVVPIFVIPYVSVTIVIAMTMVIFLTVRVRTLRSAAVAMILTWVVSYALYFLLQSYIQRPQLSGNDALTHMVRAVYASDSPYNDFPSLHVSLSTIVAIHWLRVDKRLGLAVSAWVALIIASTVLIHQHYVADVLGGLVLGVVTSSVSWRWLGTNSGEPANSQNRAHGL